MADTSALTRQQIKARARALVRAYHKTEFEVDPVLADFWLDERVTELCRVSENTAVEFTTDIVEGQSDYAMPGLKFLQSAQATLSPAQDSRKHRLSIRDARSMTTTVLTWQSDPQEGDPQYIVTEGGFLRLFPVPNYDAAGGLVLRGLGVITPDLWPNQSDPCPVTPSYAHGTLVFGVAVDMAQFIGRIDVAAVMEKRWRYQKSQLWAEAMAFSENGSHRTDEVGYPENFSPLNM